MAFLNRIFFGILILQIYVHAAPHDASKIEDIAKTEQGGTTTQAAEENSNSTEIPRQKRFYNPYGYGFPPISPVIYPSHNKRDNFPNVGTLGVEDPLFQIHKRVQEIANIVRQPPPPPIPHVPIFYPVLFVPSFDCRCNPNIPPPSGPSTPDNQPSPNVTTRFPEMEDDRQNWGFVINETEENNSGDGDQGNQDYSRPISFDPIRLDRPNARPPPPVEHGTVQSDAADSPNPESDVDMSPPPPPTNTIPPTSSFRPQNTNAGPFSTSRPPPQAYPPQSVPPPIRPPTPCDGAILTCCHQPQVSYDCFAIQGCPNFTPFGSPCDPNSILKVIERFQKYYGSRGG